ncbi:hypothetical protein ABIC08_009166 [Bradyrhizobium sp. RT9b]
MVWLYHLVELCTESAIAKFKVSDRLCKIDPNAADR